MILLSEGFEEISTFKAIYLFFIFAYCAIIITTNRQINDKNMYINMLITYTNRKKYDSAVIRY